MKRKRNDSVPIGGALSELAGPVPTVHEAAP